MTSNEESLGRDLMKSIKAYFVVSIFSPSMDPLLSTMKTKRFLWAKAGGSSYG
jgi:hypothetical protein